MLVLARKQGETVRIGNDIEIVLVKSGEKVRIGIDAPRGMKIIRGELETFKDGQVRELGANTRGDSGGVQNDPTGLDID